MKRDDDIASRLLAGDKAALARLISWAENGDARFAGSMSKLETRIGRAWRVGVTGPPGAGKSTLVNELARLERANQRTVGILAIDPTSPFSGGALLGDRIRMEERTQDRGVYIRSMASRGSHGGLSRTAVDACDAMDAFGFDDILLETVGVGQAEYDIVSAADTVVVVLCPGAGDGIQAMKAGILEIADVLVVNKSDLAGADGLLVDLEEAVHIRQTNRIGRASCKREGPRLVFADGRVEWTTPVVACSAGTGRAVEDVERAIEQHKAFLSAGRLAQERRRKRLDHVRAVFAERLDEQLWGPGGFGERARSLLDSGRAPYDVVEALMSSIKSGPTKPGSPVTDPETPTMSDKPTSSSDKKRGAKSS
jgi:LAO/AO transport system kinase